MMASSSQQLAMDALHKGSTTIEGGDYKLMAKYKTLKAENRKLKEILKQNEMLIGNRLAEGRSD